LTIVFDSELTPNLAANGSKPRWKPRKRKIKKRGGETKGHLGEGDKTTTSTSVSALA
jgi:hypothetical protein